MTTISPTYRVRCLGMMIVVLAWPWTAAEAKPTTLVAFDYEHDGRGVPYQMYPVDGDRLAGLGRSLPCRHSHKTSVGCGSR